MRLLRVLPALALLTAAGASAQVKPRFMVAFDTSGSMNWDLAGDATYGDGVGRPALAGDPQALVADGVFYGCGTSAGLDRDCDGLPNDSRLAIAKSAVRDMLSAYGDVEWALSRFNQTQGVDLSCSRYGGTSACDTQSRGNPQCNSGTIDNDGCVSEVPSTSGRSHHSLKDSDHLRVPLPVASRV